MKKSSRYGAASIAAVILVGFFLFAPVVPFQLSPSVTSSFKVTIQSYGSLGYLLAGVGTAPFSGLHGYRLDLNGTSILLFMDGRNFVNASIPAPLSQAPIADVHLRLLLNTTQFSGSTLEITLRNIGDSNITLISFTTQFSGLLGQPVSIAPDQTQTVSFVVYSSPPPVAGEAYPISIYGTILNGSEFRYYSSIEAT